MPLPFDNLLLAYTLTDIFPKEVVDAILKCGPFATGTLFGCAVTMWANKVAGNERRERQKLEREHEKELLKQIRTQQERIDALHRKLEAKPK
jgi:hypothetical protein